MNFACFVQFLLEKASLCLKGGGGRKKQKNPLQSWELFFQKATPVYFWVPVRDAHVQEKELSSKLDLG